MSFLHIREAEAACFEDWSSLQDLGGVLNLFLSVNKQKYQTADCTSSSSPWMQFLLNETTLENSIYYCVTKSSKKECVQKNMDFVDDHSTPSPVTLHQRVPSPLGYRTKALNVFYDLGEWVLSWTQFMFGNLFTVIYGFELLSECGNFLELLLSFRNHLFNINRHIIKGESVYATKLFCEQKCFILSVYFAFFYQSTKSCLRKS